MHALAQPDRFGGVPNCPISERSVYIEALVAGLSLIDCGSRQAVGRGSSKFRRQVQVSRREHGIMRGASEHRAMIGSADQFTDHNALFLTQRNGPVVLSHRAAARRAAQTPGNVGQTSVFARCSLVLMSVRWRSRDSAAGFENATRADLQAVGPRATNCDIRIIPCAMP